MASAFSPFSFDIFATSEMPLLTGHAEQHTLLHVGLQIFKIFLNRGKGQEETQENRRGQENPRIIHDRQWSSMIVKDHPWSSMIVHDLPWSSMIVHDCPWLSMNVHDCPWLSIFVHDWSGLSIILHELLWLSLIIHDNHPCSPMIVHVLYFQLSEQNVFSQLSLQAFSTLLGSRSKRFSRQASKEGLVAYLKTSLQKVCLSCLGTLLVLCLLLDCIHAVPPPRCLATPRCRSCSGCIQSVSYGWAHHFDSKGKSKLLNKNTYDTVPNVK